MMVWLDAKNSMRTEHTLSRSPPKHAWFTECQGKIVEKNLADEIVPLPDIAQRLCQLLKG